ncbi:hypothetical protein BDF14DRAFT_1744371 [Spinellus fusiger]|nr:hypothetical protein BDF14DRAFT_1744371 [Spinellus fusiger]
MSSTSSYCGSIHSYDSCIHCISAGDSPREILTPRQQIELIQQGNGHPMKKPKTTPFNLSSEAEKITQLERLWVFSASDADNSNVWKAFDYDNQIKLFEHVNETQHPTDMDQGVEFFDTHIKHGILPVLVVLSQQLGYYPTDLTGDIILKVKIACFDNASDVKFVYRK